MALNEKYRFVIPIVGSGVIIGSLVQILDIVRLMQFAISFGATIGVLISSTGSDHKGRQRIIRTTTGVVSTIIAVTSFIGVIDIITLVLLAIGFTLIVGGLSNLTGN